MKVVVPRELAEGETRVAATPRTVKRMDRAGLEVHVEAGAGQASGITDSEFTEAGATLIEDRATLFAGSEIILCVKPPDPETITQMPSGAFLIAVLDPLIEHEVVTQLADRGVSAFSLDMVPRIARAQSMDVLSSMSTLTGYQAVLLAAMALPGVMPYLTTAAGTLHPSKVLVLGAGVAGLQAIATARRLGALVWGYDIRPVVKEQVESLGAEFLELIDTSDAAEDAGGYAKEQSQDQAAEQQRAMTAHLAEMDAVITTALIPGRPAPILLTTEMVEAMKPGSVIVDLAVENGGNCALSEMGKVVEVNGVKIIGHANFPARLAVDASSLYARNLFNFLSPHIDGETGGLSLDFEDETVSGVCLTRDGAVIHLMLTADLLTAEC